MKEIVESVALVDGKVHYTWYIDINYSDTASRLLPSSQGWRCSSRRYEATAADSVVHARSLYQLTVVSDGSHKTHGLPMYFGSSSSLPGASAPWMYRKARDMACALHPQSGDSWYYMDCPICRVMQANDDCVVFTEDYEVAPGCGWRWKDNPIKLQRVTPVDFVKRLTYEISPHLVLLYECIRPG